MPTLRATVKSIGMIRVLGSRYIIATCGNGAEAIVKTIEWNHNMYHDVDRSEKHVMVECVRRVLLMCTTYTCSCRYDTQFGPLVPAYTIARHMYANCLLNDAHEVAVRA
jgi:hypothetical protein